MADGCMMPAETWILGRFLRYWWYCSHAIATVPWILPSATGEDSSSTAGQKCLHLSRRPKRAPVSLAPCISRRWSEVSLYPCSTCLSVIMCCSYLEISCSCLPFSPYNILLVHHGGILDLLTHQEVPRDRKASPQMQQRPLKGCIQE